MRSAGPFELAAPDSLVCFASRSSDLCRERIQIHLHLAPHDATRLDQLRRALAHNLPLARPSQLRAGQQRYSPTWRRAYAAGGDDVRVVHEPLALHARLSIQIAWQEDTGKRDKTLDRGARAHMTDHASLRDVVFLAA